MLNFVALAVVAAAVNGPLTVQGSVSPITPDVGNASLPVIFGGNGHIGIIYAPLMAVLYRLAALPDDARVRDPDRRRQPRRRALRRHVAHAG